MQRRGGWIVNGRLGRTLGMMALALALAALTSERAQAAGATSRVSVSNEEAQATGASDEVSISGDGRYVAFASLAWNLVPGDTNARRDVFIREHQLGVTQRVSVATGGAQADNASYTPTLNDDGRFVAFASAATNLVSGDTNAATDIFVHVVQSKTTIRASVATGGGQATGSSARPQISANGRIVVFESNAPDLVPSDGNGAWDVFAHDLSTGATTRVSVPTGGLA